jgi:hypothetical protein
VSYEFSLPFSYFITLFSWHCADYASTEHVYFHCQPLLPLIAASGGTDPPFHMPAGCIE